MPEQTRTTSITLAPNAIRAAAPTETATGREFSGVAVPWNTPIEIFGLREQFLPGSIETPDAGVLVCWRHDEPIGRVTGNRDSDAGWEIDGALSDTTLARDAATLLRDEVITSLSIRFDPLESTVDKDGLVSYSRALVREVSLVPIPAYETAEITAVRSRPTQQNPSQEGPDVPTTEETQDLSEIRSSIDELGRRIELIGTAEETPEPHPLAQFRSIGDYAQKLAAGDESAARAYTGGTSGDVLLPNDVPWVGDLIRIMTQQQRVARAFTFTNDLPPTGKTLEYGKLGSDTTQVTEQAAEGDNLPFGKITLDSANAPIKTFGGYTELTRQEIERSSRNILDLAFEAMAQSYAKRIELYVRGIVDTAHAARVTAGDVVAVGGFDTDTVLEADDVLEMLITLAEKFDDRQRNLDGMLVARDVFLALSKVKEDKKILQITSAPTDKLGTLTISSVEANLSNLKVGLYPNWGAGKAMAFDKRAIKTQESPGAPTRLQDENIVNLSKSFSVYGYAASYAQIPDAIVPVTFGTEAPAV